MSDDQKESTEKPRVRKIVRSAATSARPGFETPAEGEKPEGGAPAPDAPAAAAAPEGDAGSARKWDVRAERSPSALGPRPPRRDRRPPRADGPRADGAPREGGPDLGPRPPRRDRPRLSDADLAMPRRPGVPTGRVMPEMRSRGADRSSPEFVDRWLNQPPRKPEDRPARPPRDGARDGQPRDGQPGERRERRERRPEGDAPRVRLAAKPAVAPAPSKPLPTLSETILVGLPRVALEKQKEAAVQNKPKTAREALVAKTSQAAPKKEGSASKGEIVVDPKWVATSANGAVAALKEAGAGAEALVDAWVHAKNVEAIVEAAEQDSPGRKAARRALGVLRARGIAIPERKAASVVSASAEPEVLEATFNPPDGAGRSSIIITKRRGGDRAHIAEVTLRERIGVTGAAAGWMSRSQIKEAQQNIADSTGVSPAAVPVEWARWRIQKALEENAKSGQLVPLNLEKCKELLEPAVAAEPAHPLAELEAGIAEGTPAASIALHNEPEFRSWVPDGRAIDDVLRKVGQRLSNGDDAKDAQKVDEALKEEIKAATDRYFTPEERATLARRLRDVSITVRARAGADRAKEVLATAKAIEAAGLITSPPSEIEFLRAFVQKGIALYAQQTGGQLRIPMANAG